MAGKACPECDKFTFFQSSTGRKCSNCGFQMILPINEGKGGKGSKCSNCDKFTVFKNKCTSCGAMFKSTSK